MTLPVKWVTRQEMLSSYVARFNDLKGSDKGLPDSDIPSHYKAIYNVFGFEPPSGKGSVNPVGDDAHSLISPKAGFSLGMLKTTPGNGPILHNHNTNETFMPITGRWRVAWNEGSDYAFVDVGPCDVVSFPPGVARRFFNVTEGEPGVEHVLLFVVAGNAPEAAYTPEATKRINGYHDGVGAVVSHRGVQRNLLRPVGD